jgi:hypothetical protein
MAICYLTAWNQNMPYLEVNEPLLKWAQEKYRLEKQLLKQWHQISSKKIVSIDWQKVNALY